MGYLFKRLVRSSLRFLTCWSSLDEPGHTETVVMRRVDLPPADSLAGAAPPVGLAAGEDAGEGRQTAAGPEAGAVPARV